ncbi:GIY-YIG nuclease family protein [Flavimarina sp. Hel_I_48]|uniref:GIY-YIG nuclease family protein n=1 Tax=Flavimarina sp. Hel_I_48 TaxID=1392488 RepID=UPI0004DF9CE0|nr:GIY-YIG nuclease family protein [Flavimarina sp. Hel_I_48]
MEIYSVYILECSDDSYYTGITSDVHKRLTQHQSGKNKNAYTYFRRPVVLSYYCEFTEPEMAIDFEKKIKKWSRAKKAALIAGHYDKLPNLAKKKFN